MNDFRSTEESQSGLPDTSAPPIVVEAREAFERERPRLQLDYRDMWVAYHGAAFLGASPSKTQLYNECLKRGLNPDDFCVWHVSFGVDNVEQVLPREV